MPEALVVLVVFSVAVLAWFGAWQHARNPANHRAADERVRLQQNLRWLEERLAVARRENWDESMIAGITTELRVTLRQLQSSDRRDDVSTSERG
jgi:Tfp pilus assembly protein PilV